ncbi:MAG: cellulase family glycosylhydrolase [Oscillospiraceae bacterium]|nr:cellulase family glycosylhydrolase [Oscillospiraceae bacterium]
MSCNSDYPDETETASTDEDAVSDSLTETADADNEAELRRIFIKDGSFHVGGSEAKPIWINGTNTPWDKWNDFGGGYNDEWWDAHFAALHENGVNAVRVWINCNNGQNAVIIDENGMVSGISDKHREDLDAFFDTARRNQIYIMATLLSFDHFKGNTADRWRNMVQSKEAVDSFVTNYTLPFVNRYKDNPYLWSIDLMNEPDWVHENAECGQLAWEDLSYFFAVNTAAIRENSPILVTVGMAFPKYNADGNGYEGNKVSDEFMQVLYDNPNASLDFWSPHYYDWVGRWYGVPFTSSSYGLRSEGGWGLCDSKPAIIAETSAMGSAGYTLTEDYINAFDNGWQGVMAWTSNGVDDNGGFEELTPATRYIAEMYAELVFPLG